MRTILKAVCAGLLAATATFAVAHEGHSNETKQTVIVTDGEHAEATAGTTKCSRTPEVDVTDEKKAEDGEVKRSRIVVCSDGQDGAQVVQHLERARESIARQENIPAEARAKALAALDAAIARHRKN